MTDKEMLQLCLKAFQVATSGNECKRMILSLGIEPLASYRNHLLQIMAQQVNAHLERHYAKAES